VFITDSAFKFENDLSPWQVSEFEILKKKDNQIVATNPGQFYEHVRVVNVAGPNQPVTMTAKWPYNSADLLNSFVTQGATPVHCYQQLAGSSSWSEVSCQITFNASTGTATASIASVPAGATVWMTVHLDYAGKTRIDPTMTPRTFVFSAVWTDGPLVGSSSAVVVGRPKKVTMVYGTVSTTSGAPLAGMLVTLYSGATPKATYETGTDGFYVFFNDMSCSTDFQGSGGCASGPTGNLSVPAGPYTVTSEENALYFAKSGTGSVQATQAIRIDLKPTAKP
jgi:hypothetical protein